MPRSFSRMATLSPRVLTRCQNSAGTVSKPSSWIGCVICTFMCRRSRSPSPRLRGEGILSSLPPTLGALPALLAAHRRFLHPEIELAHVLVLDELGAGPFQHDAPDLQHI